MCENPIFRMITREENKDVPSVVCPLTKIALPKTSCHETKI